MSFDKAKAMRNAERFVAQGKIRAAIAEYRSVVDNDPRDIATLNMLGDLYAKNSEKKEAVACYLQVAEHYNTQGFSQKAIAIYNKISRIQPESIEVSAKLAELHKIKGSLSEARSHYTTLAEHYQKNGRRLEALAMYKQIALLDPNNTEVCMNLADSYIRENQKDDALEAYAEAGARFSRQGKHEEAIRALMKGFDIKSTDLRILNGLVKAQTALGRAGKASSLLEEILENEPYNRDVLYLLIECCIDSQNAAGAEKAVIKLVEIEPANYPKFLDLIRIYLNVNDPESAARILTMSSEYLLAGGQSDECGKWINEILERDPAQLSGLRLLVRYNSWLKDENGFRLALERLYTAAAGRDSVDDERFALSQLVVIRPHETRFRDRLNEINEPFGYEDAPIDQELMDAQFAKDERSELESSSVDHGEEDHEVIDGAILESSSGFDFKPANDAPPLSASAEQKIEKELESITFYIENDYNDLAEKALAELAAEFGDREEFAELRRKIGVEYVEQKPVEASVVAEEHHEELVASTLGIDEIRSEFGLESGEDQDDEDYETHYHMAVAYQEMGLMEEAIREYQEAVSLVETHDGTRRFFQCSNLLGHCFLQSGKPKHAITWFERALDTPDIADEEYHGLWYELARAHEVNGDEANAARYFEQVYAENVDFRDVSVRVKNLVASN
ncbi:MAG TPA: tetratricopeptide repeat protein [Pyrinomonadaceae bacterium]|nr:tetratricopeptide repeat protein [Acidobacteriota bacterium]HQZ97404.1 tetratricopeptide repeat protein [Pyrinomonadaceae bacterium]